MASSRLQLISRKFIKPSFSTPSPPLMRNYKLGLLDQLMHNIHMPFAFYYPNKTNDSSSASIDTTILENSFSKVLASYYPLAGRVVDDNIHIDCTEMGATLIEAHVNCKMTEILGNPNLSAQDEIFPRGLPWKYNEERLLVAQISHFDCGGKAISLCMSHKVADGQALCSFARDWASLTKLMKQSGDKNQSSPSIQLNAASIFPPIEEHSIKPEFGWVPTCENSVTKRFVFDGSKISEMKAIVSAETGITNPTRVEVVTALLHKCAHSAASIADPNSCKLPMSIQIVNARPLMNPPIPPNYLGNICSHFGAPFSQDLTFPRLVSELRKAKVELYDKLKGVTTNVFRQEVLNTVEYIKMIKEVESTLDIYTCSSLCSFPFHELDFGWGGPERTTIADPQFTNVIILMDGRDGGVEAFVPLKEEEMIVFERDPELLRFASLGS